MNIAAVMFWQSKWSEYDNIVGAPFLLPLLRSIPNLQLIITYVFLRWFGTEAGVGCGFRSRVCLHFRN
jgi:hypothetical protein